MYLYIFSGASGGVLGRQIVEKPFDRFNDPRMYSATGRSATTDIPYLETFKTHTHAICWDGDTLGNSQLHTQDTHTHTHTIEIDTIQMHHLSDSLVS